MSKAAAVDEPASNPQPPIPPEHVSAGQEWRGDGYGPSPYGYDQYPADAHSPETDRWGGQRNDQQSGSGWYDEAADRYAASRYAADPYPADPYAGRDSYPGEPPVHPGSQPYPAGPPYQSEHPTYPAGQPHYDQPHYHQPPHSQPPHSQPPHSQPPHSQPYHGEQYSGEPYREGDYPQWSDGTLGADGYRPPQPRQPAGPYPAADAPTGYLAAVGDRPTTTGTDDYYEPLPDAAPSRLSVLLWTGGIFLIPVFAYLFWAVSRSDAPPPGCTGVDSGVCASARADAVGQLMSALPWLVLAGALAILVASGLRRISGWRGGTVAFAAAVIGTGITTLVASALG